MVAIAPLQTDKPAREIPRQYAVLAREEPTRKLSRQERRALKRQYR